MLGVYVAVFQCHSVLYYLPTYNCITGGETGKLPKSSRTLRLKLCVLCGKILIYRKGRKGYHKEREEEMFRDCG